MQKKLPWQEWTVIILLIIIIGMMTLISWRSNTISIPLIMSSKQENVDEISVTISGAVSKPGVYVLKKGTALQELLNRAETTPEADLSRMKKSNKLKNGQYIHIRKKTMITIYIEGAIENPGPLFVPKGTLVKDIQDKVILLPEANPKKLKAKRRLKDQEHIIIGKIK